MIKFIGGFGCTCEDVEVAFIADNEGAALDAMHNAAVASYESFEGLHGIRDRVKIAEDEGYDTENMADEDWVEVEEIYIEEVENDIHYWAESFNENNPEHIRIFEENSVWETAY